MAKSHPARFDHHSVLRRALIARNATAKYAILSCLVLLGATLHKFYSPHIPALAALTRAALDSAPALPDALPVAADPNTSKYRAIGEHLARRFRVSSEMTTNIVAKAYEIGQEFKLDPLLILAVIAVESRFNPVAESAMGAKGLMQVIPRFHPDKFGPLGGEHVAFDTGANIEVGARILKDYIRRTGDLADALQMYVGASSDESENGYSAKVVLERDRLNQVLRQYQNRDRLAQRQPAARPAATAI